MQSIRCPKCNVWMTKITGAPYLNDDTFYYRCYKCNYISELMTDNNRPFGKNYSDCPDNEKDLKDWENEKKYSVINRLKKEHKKIIDKNEKLGKITKDDYNNWLIDIYLANEKKIKGILKNVISDITKKPKKGRKKNDKK